MDGTNACPCDATASPCTPAGLRGGILPPPKFRAMDFSQAGVAGNFSLRNSVNVVYSTSQPLNLGGSFDNQATVPQCFDWANGRITMTNASSPPGPTFEVAGRDLGAVEAGFGNALDSNFALGRLEVISGARVTFTNAVANLNAAGPCQEALYVKNLILRSGAVVTLNNCKVYYDSLVNEGASLTPQGCGALVEVAPCAMLSDCFDGNTCTVDGCDSGTGSCSHAPIATLIFGDADNTGIVDSDDILCVLGAFQGFLSETCPLERADLWPCETPACFMDSDCADAGTGSVCLLNGRCGCGTDGDCLGGTCDHGRCRLLDVDDILAILDAFVGIPPLGTDCPAPCP